MCSSDLGYPDMLFGPDLPLGARIIRIADTWDALTNSRPWRDVLPLETALDEMRLGAGTEFDPELIQLFLELQASDSLKPSGNYAISGGA